MPSPLPALALITLGFFCGNVVTEEDGTQSVKNLKVVDAALEVNNFPKAKQWLDWVLGYLIVAKQQSKTIPAGHARRYARARALLLSRDPKSTNAQREEAKTIYEKQVLGKTPDPAAQADFAEIQSRIPSEAATATTTLRGLRDKDLIGSPQAYAALAELEKAAGDSAASTAARDKCKTQTKVLAICEPTPPAPAANP